MQKKLNRKKGVYEGCIVVVITAAIWGIHWLIWGAQPFVFDGQQYMNIAEGLAAVPPQSFHILTPKLAAFLLPNDPANGFIFISFVSFIGTGIMIDLLLQKQEFKTTFNERILGVLLFAATCTGVFMFHYYTFTDSLSYFLLAVACAATVYKKDLLVAVITAIAVFNRETAFFMFPVWLCFNFDRSAIPALLTRSVFVFLPAMLAYFTLHHTPLIFGDYPVHLNYLKPKVIMDLWYANLSWLGTSNIPYGLAVCVFLSYNIGWILAFTGWKHHYKQKNCSHILNSLWMLWIPVLATLLIVDWQRGFQPLFIPVTVSAVLGARRITKEQRGATWNLVAAVSVAAAYAMTEAWFLIGRMRQYVAAGMGIWLLMLLILFVLQSYRKKQHSMASSVKW